MFAPIYICPKHGETWHTQRSEIIDSEHDELYEIDVCEKCGSVVKPLLHEGHQVCHPLTDEEIFWEMQTGEDEEV